MPLSLSILITTPTFPPFNSGLGNAVQEQVRMLMSLGHRVTVATYGEHRQSFMTDGYAVEKFNIAGADSWISPIRGDVDYYRGFLAGASFDIVLLNAWQNWASDIALQMLDEIAGRKLLCSHCISTNLFFWRTPVKSMVRYLSWRPYHYRISRRLRQLDGLVTLAASGCDSRFDDLRIAKKIGVEIFVIPNALPHSQAMESNASLATTIRRRQIISVASYEWQKGHEFVLQAYAMSKAKNVVPLKFFGQKFNAYSDKLKRSAQGLDIDESFVSFHEGISGENLLEEYRNSSVFLYGSLTECQPLVLLDAMASGTPFVSRASGCIDMMKGGVAVRTHVDAAMQVDRMLDDEAWWKTQSEAGLSAVADHSHERVTRSWSAALQKVLGQAASSSSGQSPDRKIAS